MYTPKDQSWDEEHINKATNPRMIHQIPNAVSAALERPNKRRGGNMFSGP